MLCCSCCAWSFYTRGAQACSTLGRVFMGESELGATPEQQAIGLVRQTGVARNDSALVRFLVSR